MKSWKTGERASHACKKYIASMPAPIDDNILGGAEATHGEFPHMAAFRYKEIDWACAGSLISERHVLTAAHCFTNNLPTTIRLGQNTLESTEEAYVDSVIEVRVKLAISNQNI
ncbi:CLIPC6.2 family protein [Megaselia abdita]